MKFMSSDCIKIVFSLGINLCCGGIENLFWRFFLASLEGMNKVVFQSPVETISGIATRNLPILSVMPYLTNQLLKSKKIR